MREISKARQKEGHRTRDRMKQRETETEAVSKTKGETKR